MPALRLLCLLTLTAAGVWSEDKTSFLHPVRVGDKFGFVDLQGKAGLVLPAQFDWAWPYAQGRAGVRLGKDWFLIDEDGMRVSPHRYDWIGCFNQGLAPARLGRRWGYVGLNGEWKIEPYFSDARPFREGVAAVQVGGHYSIVDKTSCFEGLGIDLSPPQGDRVAPGALGGKWGLIDPQGNYVAEPSYNEVREAQENRIPFRVGPLWGFLDTKGEIAVQPRYLSVDQFRSGWARVTLLSGKNGFVDLQGNFVENRVVGGLGFTEP